MNGIAESFNKQRNSNVEFLRIIAMFMVVIGHCTGHGSIDTSTLPNGIEKWFLDSMNLGKLGVAIFIMITGYFLSQAKFNIKRIVNVVLQTVFYSVTIFAIFCIFDRATYFTVMQAITNVFPVMMSQYWFVTMYVVLSFLMPFINKLLYNIDRKQFLWLLIVLLFFYCIEPTILLFNAMQIGGYISSGILYYCIGAYIRKYPDNIFSKKHLSNILTVIVFVLIMLVPAVRAILGVQSGILNEKVETLFSLYSILFVLFSAFILITFVNMKPHYNKFINFVGGCTFGVYLIHDHDFVRNLFWGNLFNNLSYANSLVLIPYTLFSVLVVFTVCTLIEALRKYVIEKYVLKRLYDFICFLIDKIVMNINKVINKLI